MSRSRPRELASLPGLAWSPGGLARRAARPGSQGQVARAWQSGREGPKRQEAPGRDGASEFLDFS